MLREWLVVAGAENETATHNQNIKSATIMACVIAAYISRWDNFVEFYLELATKAVLRVAF